MRGAWHLSPVPDDAGWVCDTVPLLLHFTDAQTELLQELRACQGHLGVASTVNPQIPERQFCALHEGSVPLSTGITIQEIRPITHIVGASGWQSFNMCVLMVCKHACLIQSLPLFHLLASVNCPKRLSVRDPDVSRNTGRPRSLSQLQQHQDQPLSSLRKESFTECVNGEASHGTATRSVGSRASA